MKQENRNNFSCARARARVVKLSLSLTKHLAMKTWRYSSTHSLTSALDGGKRSASRTGRFTPGNDHPVPTG